MFSDPQKIINQLPIANGASVADLGAGTGAWSIPLAKKIAPDGKVYACEIQKDMLVRIENEARDMGIHNIQTVWGNIEKHTGTKLRDSTIDWVIIANVLFQVEDRPAFLKEVFRILKPGGSVVLVDWKDSYGNLGPHDKDVVHESDAEKMFADIGMKKSPMTIEAGSHHYGIVFKK